MQEKWRLNGFYSPAQLKRWGEAVSRRYSCRQMGDKPTIGQWTALSFMASRCCLPGVRLVLAECDPSFFQPPLMPLPRITGVKRFAAIIIDESVPLCRLHAGISGEAFVLEAAANGVATVWVMATFRRKECPVALKEGEKLLGVIALGQPANGWPEKIDRRRKAIEKICLGDFKAWPQWAQDAAQAVWAAPSAVNSQPWQLEYTLDSLVLSGSNRSQIDMGIAIAHMEASIPHPHVWTLGQGEKEIARVRLVRMK